MDNECPYFVFEKLCIVRNKFDVASNCPYIHLNNYCNQDKKLNSLYVLLKFCVCEFFQLLKWQCRNRISCGTSGGACNKFAFPEEL